MTEEEIKQHKRTAAGLYNRVWELMDAETRSADEDREMVVAACASRYHWSLVGGAVEIATGDWQIARTLALLGEGSTSLRFARAALDTILATADAPDFMLASVHEGVARAYAAAGDGTKRDEYIALAREALAQITEQDDRDHIAQQIDSVPGAR